MAVRPVSIACENLVHFPASMEHFSRQYKRLLIPSRCFGANGTQAKLMLRFRARLDGVLFLGVASKKPDTGRNLEMPSSRHRHGMADESVSAIGWSGRTSCARNGAGWAVAKLICYVEIKTLALVSDSN